MAEILVLVDHAEGTVKKVTLELLTKARELGTPAAVLFGSALDEAVLGAAKDKLAEYGAAKVYVAADPELDGYVVAPKAELLAKLVADAQPAAVLVPAPAEGKEIAARLAIQAGSGILTDAVDLKLDGDAFVAEQSIFGGSSIVHSTVTTGTPIVAIRPNSTPPGAESAAAERVDVSVELTDAAKLAKVVDKVVVPKGDRPELTEAAIVVSGGR